DAVLDPGGLRLSRQAAPPLRQGSEAAGCGQARPLRPGRGHGTDARRGVSPNPPRVGGRAAVAAYPREVDLRPKAAGAAGAALDATLVIRRPSSCATISDSAGSIARALARRK